MKLDTPQKRIVTGIILVVALAGLCAYYATEYQNHLKYPSYEVILSDYPQGEVVNVGGVVTSTFNGGFLMVKNHQGHLVTMKVLNDTPVTVEDSVSVVGVLAPDNTIVNVEQVEVTEYWNYIFLLLRSFLVLIFLIFIFHKYWSFDWKSYEFRRR
ncbi:hypothetical protein [Methanobacterium sp.]|uniref:hypothetical protein n=1 Tax=Methanobacterium sp. TaxID=2164 RepID=UPI002600BF12|nr:hypothetical protein [Methanobacterium sp.]MBI5459222.1 hypothetical protein [Methanobacterium sp.]